MDKRKINIKSIFILSSISLVLFTFFTAQITVEIIDKFGKNGTLYGFPIPFSFVYEKINGSIERELTLLYLIIDFLIYFGFVKIISIKLRKIFYQYFEKIPKILKIFLSIILFCFIFFVIFLIIYGNVIYPYKFVSNYNFTGVSSILYYNFFIGLIW